MKALIQRVAHASVVVDGATIGHIERGILVLVGIEKHDTADTLQRMTDKILRYRIFPDEDGKMNLSTQDIKGGVLAISQFTLAADTQKGLRPSFSSAAPPAEAEVLYDQFMALLRDKHPNVAAGRFGADMKVSLLNDGPVTFALSM